MSGVAGILLEKGKVISGSDIIESNLTQRLREKGARIFLGHSRDRINKDIELVIISAAIKDDNVELSRARELNIPVITYSNVLGMLMKERKGIAVAGTHGKTTTASLIAFILKESGKEPSFVIGGETDALGGNFGLGKGEYFVAEACEYNRNFLYLFPYISVITNIEKDHLDYYQNLNDIKESFFTFISQTQKNGLTIFCAEDPILSEFGKRLNSNFYTYGFEKGDYRIGNVDYRTDSTNFHLNFRGERLGNFSLLIPGKHNLLNATAAFAVAHQLGLKREEIGSSLSSFSGVRRRLQLKGKFNGRTIIDDYGHHPTEIKASLSAIKQFYPDSRILVVFQPHQYSRTRFFLSDFAGSFQMADIVIIPDIYFVRDSELERRLVSSKDLVRKIKERGKEALYFSDFARITSYILKILKPGDVVLTIGAGPVFQIADALCEKLRAP